jgi:hypothetical protein
MIPREVFPLDFPAARRRQVDGGDAERGEGDEAAVDPDLELAPARVARVQPAIMVGVEHILHRLEVAGRALIPFGEGELLLLADPAVAVRVDDQHPGAVPCPGHARLPAVAVQLGEEGRGGQGVDVEAVAFKIDEDGNAAAEAAAGCVGIALIVRPAGTRISWPRMRTLIWMPAASSSVAGAVFRGGILAPI